MWDVSDPASHGNRQPLVVGARFSIFKRPGYVLNLMPFIFYFKRTGQITDCIPFAHSQKSSTLKLPQGRAFARGDVSSLKLNAVLLSRRDGDVIGLETSTLSSQFSEFG